MKTKNIQAAFWGIILSVAIAIPTSVTAQNKSRNDRQPHSSVKKQKQKHQKQVANYNYQRDRRYQNHKNKHKHYQKGVYKTGYNQHAHQIHNYYPSYSKGGYKTVFNCLPPNNSSLKF